VSRDVSRRDTRQVAWALGLAWLAGLAAMTVISATGHESWTYPIATGVVTAPAVVVGFLVAARMPAVPIGALLVALGALPTAGLALEEWGGTWATADPLPAAAVAATLTVYATWPWWYLSPALIALTFPDGRLPSPRWRWVVAGVIAVPVLLTAALALDTTWSADADGPVPGAPPVWVPGWLSLVFLGPGLALLISTLVLAVVALVGRYRRGDAVTRLQVRWLAIGAAVFPIALLTAWLTIPFVGDRFTSYLIAFLAVGVMTMPLAVAVAVLKHGLWSLDRLVSRTLAYALVTATMVATYAVVVTSLARLLPVSSALAVATATLAAAAVFRPVLRRVQEAVDRRFNRERYDAQRVVDGFGARLRGETDPDAAAADLVAAVGRALEPGAVGLWVRGGAR